MSENEIDAGPSRGRVIALCFIVFIIVYVILRVFVFQPSLNLVSYTDNNFYVLDLSIPANLDFCGEKIPSNNYEIKNDLKREFFANAYWKNNSLALFRKAQRWFPYIEPILKQEGVPDDFKYLAVIESHLSNSSSPAGAAGFWQLVPGSARNYGLEVNEGVDERYHIEKATRAACKHIKDAYKVFKNWTLAAAAYNLGIGGITGALRRQGTDNYFDLLLNRETGSFVYRILAYKTLFSSPGHFGIKKRKLKYFPKMQLHVFKVDSSITHLEAFAKHIGCDKATIRSYNPWLLKDGLHNPAKIIYEIQIPKNTSADYSGYIADMAREGSRNVSTSTASTIAVQDQDSSVHANSTVIAQQQQSKPLSHTFKATETIKDIAVLYGVKEEDLRKWNNLKETEKPEKGQILVMHAQVKK